jgi:hypothetical protein
MLRGQENCSIEIGFFASDMKYKRYTSLFKQVLRRDQKGGALQMLTKVTDQ